MADPLTGHLDISSSSAVRPGRTPVLDAPISVVQTVKATHATVDERFGGSAEQMASTLRGTGAGHFRSEGMPHCPP